MLVELLSKSGAVFELHPSLMVGSGGEARIFVTPYNEHLVVKLYHEPSEERARKLKAMIANPPVDPMLPQGHRSIAWPLDLVRSTEGKQPIVGYVMPRVRGMRPIVDFYNPSTRREESPLFSYRYLVRTARNLAAAMQALHEAGYVIGDVNESNILVSETALLTLVDTDSFQVRDRDGFVYRCPVGKPEYTPPELAGKSFAEIDRQPEHDRFGLAILLFQLLMEGTHPFNGLYEGQGEPDSLDERIAAGYFPYDPVRNHPYRPMPVAPSFEMLPADVRQAFIRCFVEGDHHPRLRPDANEWQEMLHEAEKTLVPCYQNEQHFYGHHLKHCPWCERAAQLGGRDPFPSRASVQRGKHLQPVLAQQEALPRAGTRSQPKAPVFTKDTHEPRGIRFLVQAAKRALKPLVKAFALLGVAMAIWFGIGGVQGLEKIKRWTMQTFAPPKTEPSKPGGKPSGGAGTSINHRAGSRSKTPPGASDKQGVSKRKPNRSKAAPNGQPKEPAAPSTDPGSDSPLPPLRTDETNSGANQPVEEGQGTDDGGG